MPTRQQKRARARLPTRKKRRGTAIFTAAILAIVLAGGVAASVFKSNPKPLTRGAIPGEHWHAPYRIELCGKKMGDYPFFEGDLHSHGDGVMHLHPQTPATSGDNANLANFLATYETTLRTLPDGKSQLVLPDGSTYTDGGTCPGSDTKHNLELFNKGKPVSGPPGAFIPHNGDDVILRFGPRATSETANPLTPNQPPTQGSPVPQPSAAPPGSPGPEATTPSVTPAPS